jgi:hypothetical protein
MDMSVGERESAIDDMGRVGMEAGRRERRLRRRRGRAKRVGSSVLPHAAWSLPPFHLCHRRREREGERERERRRERVKERLTEQVEERERRGRTGRIVIIMDQDMKGESQS